MKLVICIHKCFYLGLEVPLGHHRKTLPLPPPLPKNYLACHFESSTLGNQFNMPDDIRTLAATDTHTFIDPVGGIRAACLPKPNCPISRDRLANHGGNSGSITLNRRG